MRNYYFSLILFVSIILFCFACNIFTHSNLRSFQTKFEKFEKADYVTEALVNDCNSMKNEFYKEKNMLQLFVNKEHIKELEKNILLIENALINQDINECQKISIESLCLVHQIRDYTTAID